MAAHERPDGSLNALSILQITLYRSSCTASPRRCPAWLSSCLTEGNGWKPAEASRAGLPRSDHFNTATTFSTLLNSRHHPFNGRRSSSRGGASDSPYIR
ncbi:hypothetical protein VTN00DRAFT_3420 [Thermoascus crustaceus]|uniref:uncharacterized protein n=1 Tax=Thermoascus crustaceus TaxID=5088 RepID=UPI003742D1E6